MIHRDDDRRVGRLRAQTGPVGVSPLSPARAKDGRAASGPFPDGRYGLGKSGTSLTSPAIASGMHLDAWGRVLLRTGLRPEPPAYDPPQLVQREGLLAVPRSHQLAVLGRRVERRE